MGKSLICGCLLGAHLQSTGFLLDPAGRVLVSVHSSGAIGRLRPEDVLAMVSYLLAHAST